MKKSFATLINLLISVSVFSQIPWSLTGNANTTTYNFVGSTDINSLILRVDNQWAGFTRYQDKSNISFRYLPLNILNSGGSKTIFGSRVLPWNSIGTLTLRNNRQSYNTAIESQAPELNTRGYRNTALDSGALNQSTTGLFNKAVAYCALCPVFIFILFMWITHWWIQKK